MLTFGAGELSRGGKSLLARLSAELASHGLDVRSMKCVATLGENGIETPNFNANEGGSKQDVGLPSSVS